jgi:tryptophanyl-tRNA synthetase
MKKRVFSGIQPTGSIHIGNYLAAIRKWVESQEEYTNFFSIVDLHAITVPQDPEGLKAKTREVAGILFAAGINPSLSAVFVQSQISAHAEMTWVLNCTIPMGWMLRMTQYKEKSAHQRELVSTGLFDYPALMAADILLYHTDLVPVGRDQKQHVELARDAAQRFNSLYGQTLKLPEPVIPEKGARIMGLDNPLKKMSKTDTQEGHAIGLLDPPDEIRRKIMRATTDSLREIRFDESRPGIHNLLTIYELFTGLPRQEIENRFDGKGYAKLKQELADVITADLAPLQARYHELIQEPGQVDLLLAEGVARAKPIAEATIREVKEKMGLG